MSEDLNIGINPEQREILLRGLRYVRSSVLLTVSEPDEEPATTREEQLRQIEELVEQLRSVRPAGAV